LSERESVGQKPNCIDCEANSWQPPDHGSVDEASTALQRAVQIARRQSAKAWELRAAISLARLWRDQGRHADARELLAPVYAWFTEGLKTSQVQEAKALLDTLGE
jgi:predicted ATPase